MKILQVHNFYQTPGGEDSVVRAEKELLESKGHSIIPYYRHNDEIKNYDFTEKIKFFRDTVYSKGAFSRLGELADKEKPDVAHIHNVFPLISPSAYYTLRSRKIPIVQTVHNYRFLCPNGFFYTKGAICRRCARGNTLHCLFNRCYKDSFLLSGLYAMVFLVHRRRNSFLKNVDIFIVLNNFTMELLVGNGFPPDRIKVVGNFLPVDNTTSCYEKEDYAVFMGRLSSEKGIMTLLEAFLKTGPIKLKIAGTGILEKRIREYIKEKGMEQVEMMGFVSGNEKRELLRKAKASIIPSEWYENFPMSAVESLSVGTPVIASRIGGLSELIEDGLNGLLFNPGDSDELAEKIKHVFVDRDKSIAMGAYAYKRAKELYSPEIHYNKLMETYKEAIEAKETK